jgi:hypothetical protein
VTATPRMDTAADVLRWRVHPARERIVAAVFALTVILVMAFLASSIMHSLGWGLLAVAVQVLALRRFFLPSEFLIDADGVTASTLWARRQYRWDEIRRFLCDAQGGFLSTRSNSSSLDLFRGIHLVFGKNREAVVCRIQGHLREETAA